MADAELASSGAPLSGRVEWTDLADALRAGWRDFRRAPLFGLFFSAFYGVAGAALLWLGAGTVSWVLTLSLGFPLIAPFAAVGLYEISRRLEAGDRPTWRGVLGVVAEERGRQIPWIGAIIVIAFLFWTFLAHMLFALILGLGAFRGGVGLAELMTVPGLVLVGVELAVGGLFAILLYALTVISLPMCLDREVDFVSAMLTSLATVRANTTVMLVWAVILGAGLLVGLLPAFLGLLVVLPVLGHASWHLYRRAMPQ